MPLFRKYVMTICNDSGGGGGSSCSSKDDSPSRQHEKQINWETSG